MSMEVESTFSKTKDAKVCTILGTIYILNLTIDYGGAHISIIYDSTFIV